MRWIVDLLYLAVALLTSPIWLVRMVRTGKIRTDWRGRFGRTPTLPAKRGRRLLVHAVSVGEVNAVRQLIERLAAPEGPQGLEIVVATTTDTGFKRACQLWGEGVDGGGGGRVDGGADGGAVVRYPFDFSMFVRRFLRAIDPDIVALVELEIWPNFTAECVRRGVPVCVINGRLTERSLRRYRRVRSFVCPSFARLSRVGAQNSVYGERFIALGTPRERVTITGTMKWDTAVITHEAPGADEIADAMGINRAQPLVVAGSTAPGEHELLMQAVPPGVQLLCAPRKPEWFEQAARTLGPCVRRSQPESRMNASSGRFLLDTIGELRKAYALADVVVVGRSFGNLHGSDMMEPIALGKATIVGPAVKDFQETVDALLAGDGIIQIPAEALGETLGSLLRDRARREQLAANGRAVIRDHQGATDKTIELIGSCLSFGDEAAKNKPAVAAGGRDGGGGERRKAVGQSTVINKESSF